jgi:predicted metal-binding membrane protein
MAYVDHGNDDGAVSRHRRQQRFRVVAEQALGLRRGRARQLKPSPTLLAVAITAVAIVTWVVTVDRMRGMDAGPGTDLGQLGWFVGVWVTMMAAMMLPSVMPMTLVFARVSAERRRRGQSFVPTWVFIAGYLAVWTVYGLIAYAIFRAVASAHIHALGWSAQGPYIAGGAIIVAGIYQLTPLKRVCLRHCRSPMHYVLGGWRPGAWGAVRMGAEHGGYCVGCCWGLMLILFALGVMSILWMLVVAGIIFAEKVLPVGEGLSRVLAIGFVALGIWVAAAPASVPGLTEPGSQAMSSMKGMSPMKSTSPTKAMPPQPSSMQMK